MSLRLPGQPERRGRGDYQARPLTDAVLTAIERAHPLTDAVLDGLGTRLITHDAAKGLWGLVVAASLTGAEEELLADSDPDWPELSHRPARRPLSREVAESVVEAMREREAWHARYRHALMAHFTWVLLSGPDAQANAAMLHEQDLAWEKVRHDLYNATDRSHWLLVEAPEGDDEAAQGRGSSAVWRGRRRVALEDLGEWLRSHAGPGPVCELDVDPPGCRLRLPSGWHSLVLPAGVTPSPVWAGHVQHGRVLELEVRNRTVLWPAFSPASGGMAISVPGVEAAIAALAPTVRRNPLMAVEAILVRFDKMELEDEPRSTAVTCRPVCGRQDEQAEPGRSDCHNDRPVDVPIPAAIACDLGLIDTATRDQLTAEAGVNVLQDMREAVADLEYLPEPLDDRALAALRSSLSLDKLGYFTKILRRAGIAFTPRVARWHWSIRSVADAIEQGHVPGAVTWLASWSVARVDERARERRSEAWDSGFVRFGAHNRR